MDLSGTKVSDKGLVYLSGLNNLKHLDIGATQIRGSGLKCLSKLRSLSYISLYSGTDPLALEMDKVAVKELKRSIPGLQINPFEDAWNRSGPGGRFPLGTSRSQRDFIEAMLNDSP